MANLITTLPQLKAVLLGLMVAEANDVASKLEINETLPIRTSTVKMAMVPPPEIMVTSGVVGVIDTANWTYSFPGPGKLSYLICLKPNFWSRNDLKAYKPYATSVSLIDTNKAYSLATNWLTKFSVDVERLNNECELRIKNKQLREMVLPEYSVVWRKGTNLIASIRFLEPTRQIWQIYIEDPSYLSRPSITNSLRIEIRSQK